ncbi:Aste57867_21263 [Aphanomyces stellatus]|uniref:Aste57867_21263 protein n=1 Tax=Aphanomyces stellatus TaxID=120398 RepID=A0A485LH14_9STRA|nr:hypothetical protein As57867_021194 [Aphanomyces stellatus]VFT97935.1 Aste57867_21263 [Aphanomyces stellatus]
MNSTWPVLKLTYFDVASRGEITRLALAIGGIPFEDERIPRDQWPQLKPTLPFQQMPVLTVDGDMIAQSAGIARYVGTLAGLYPSSNPLDAARVDEIVLFTDDILSVGINTMSIADEEARHAHRQVLSATTLLNMFTWLEARLVAKARGEMYFLDDISLADLAVFVIVGSMKTAGPGFNRGIADGFPKIMSIYDAVQRHPKVVAWYAAQQSK